MNELIDSLLYKNLLANLGNDEDWSEIVENLHECLMIPGLLSIDIPNISAAMFWGKSPQGYDYWSSIYNRQGEIGW